MPVTAATVRASAAATAITLGVTLSSRGCGGGVVGVVSRAGRAPARRGTAAFPWGHRYSAGPAEPARTARHPPAPTAAPPFGPAAATTTHWSIIIFNPSTHSHPLRSTLRGAPPAAAVVPGCSTPATLPVPATALLAVPAATPDRSPRARLSAGTMNHACRII